MNDSIDPPKNWDAGCFPKKKKVNPCFLRPKSDLPAKVALPTVSGMEALGTLALLWQVPDGPRGILRHPIQVKPLQADWCEDGLGWKEVEGTMEGKNIHGSYRLYCYTFGDQNIHTVYIYMIHIYICVCIDMCLYLHIHIPRTQLTSILGLDLVGVQSSKQGAPFGFNPWIRWFKIHPHLLSPKIMGT